MINKKTAIRAAFLASLTTFPLMGASLTNCTDEELMAPRFQQWERYLPHLSYLDQGNCLQIGEVQGCTTQWLINKVARKDGSHVLVMDRKNKGVLESLRKIEASPEYEERLQAFTQAFESTNDGKDEYYDEYKKSQESLILIFKKFDSRGDGIFEDPTEYKESIERLFKKFESLGDGKCEYPSEYKEENERLFNDFESLQDKNFEFSDDYKEKIVRLFNDFASLRDGKCEYFSEYKEKIELLFKDLESLRDGNFDKLPESPQERVEAYTKAYEKQLYTFKDLYKQRLDIYTKAYATRFETEKKYAEQLEFLKKNYEEYLSRATTPEEELSIEKDYADQLEGLKKSYDERFKALKKDYDYQLEILKKDYAEQLYGKKSDDEWLEGLKKYYEDQLDGFTKDFESRDYTGAKTYLAFEGDFEPLINGFDGIFDGKFEDSSIPQEDFDPFENESESILLGETKYPRRYLERMYLSANAFESTGEEKTVTLPYSNALIRKPLWGNQGPFAFIHIEGDRSMQTNLEDLVLAWTLLAKGGILVFNNYGLSSKDTDAKLALGRQALDFACEDTNRNNLNKLKGGRNTSPLYELIGKIGDWIDISDDYNASLKQSSELFRLAVESYCDDKNPYNFNFLVTILSRAQRVLDKPILWEKFDTWVGNQTITSDLKTVAPHVVDVVLNGLNAFRNDPTTFNTLLETAFQIVRKNLLPLLSSPDGLLTLKEGESQLMDLLTEVFPNVEVKNSAKTVVDGFLSIYEGQYQLLHKGYQVHLQKMVDDDFPLPETEVPSWVYGQAW